ncbi:hypothetical protein PM8797T_11174 [Gimesia maris DSM 8797]|nr:hypothetical protein PM8797T_11174 [Gimesia maris DSM 8797]
MGIVQGDNLLYTGRFNSGSRLSGRCGFFGIRGGKSGLHRARWWVTPTVREDRESATESKPPGQFAGQVRVKRCGKSAPADRVTGLAR